MDAKGSAALAFRLHSRKETRFFSDTVRGIARKMEIDPMQQETVIHRIQNELARLDGGAIVVGEAGGAIVLSGTVETRDQRERAVKTASKLAQGMQVIDSLEVQRELAEGIEDTAGINADKPNPGEPAMSPPVLLRSDLDAGTNQVPLETNASDVVDDTVYDAQDPVEPDPAYFAPTDPVTGFGQEGETSVLNGWTPTSMDSQEVPASAEDNRPGDEALAEAITRELREEAATTALRIEVEVEQGVAHLRGRVPDVSDAENAESVASRIPGVRDVVEELDVDAMSQQ